MVTVAGNDLKLVKKSSIQYFNKGLTLAWSPLQFPYLTPKRCLLKGGRFVKIGRYVGVGVVNGSSSGRRAAFAWNFNLLKYRWQIPGPDSKVNLMVYSGVMLP